MASLTDWVNNNIGDPKRKFISPIGGLYNTFSNANTSNAGLVVPGIKGLERGVTQYTNKSTLPPKPKQFKLDSMPKTDTIVKNGTSKGLGKDKLSKPLPSLVPLEAAVTSAPTAVQDIPNEVPLGMGGLSERMPYEVGNGDMFADTNKFLDSRGMTGEVALPEGQYTNLAGDGTVGLAGTPASSTWVDGLSNFETMQGAAGLGGLAMNAYGMFGSGGTMDVNKKNIELMNQQLQNNSEEMANRKGYRSDIARTFGKGL